MNYKQTDTPKIKINYQVSDIGCWKIGRSSDRAASPDFCLGTEDDCGGGDLVFCEEFLFFA